MTRKTTSKKRKFSFSDIPIRKIKPGVKVLRVDSAARLRDKEFIFRALWECLIEEDLESFKEILRAHLDAVNKQQLAKKSKPSRRTLHRILSPEGNPTLKNISSVLHALYG